MSSPPDRKPPAPLGRNSLPKWLREQLANTPEPFGDELLAAVHSDLVTDQHWEKLGQLELRIEAPVSEALQTLQMSLQRALHGLESDWKLTSAQRYRKADRLFDLIDDLQAELQTLRGEPNSSLGCWLLVHHHDQDVLHEQLELLKKSVIAWNCAPTPVSKPNAKNAARNFFIWALADSFRGRYGKSYLEMVQAFASVYFPDASDLDLSAISKYARTAEKSAEELSLIERFWTWN